MTNLNETLIKIAARMAGTNPRGRGERRDHLPRRSDCHVRRDSGRDAPARLRVDSDNVLPALRGQRFWRPIRETTVLYSGNGKFVIRPGAWVLIDARTGDDNGERGEPDWLKQERDYAPNTAVGELYDQRDDLPQRANLYAQKPEVVERLKALLEEYKAGGRSTPGPTPPNTPPDAG